MGAKPVGLPELASMILWALVATSQIAARHRMLDPITIGVIGPVFIFGMLILRMPVGIAIIAVGISGIWILGQTVSYIRFVPRLRQYKSLLWEYVANYDR